MMEIFALPYPILKTPYTHPRNSEGLAKAFLEKSENRLIGLKGEMIPPGFVLFTEGEQHHLDARQFVCDGEGKDLLVAMAKVIAKKTRAIGSVFVSEVWFAQATEKDREKISRGEEMRASTHPNKVECLMAVGEYVGSDPYVALSTMVRDTLGAVTSFKPFLLPGAMGMETRFSHILDYDVSRG